MTGPLIPNTRFPDEALVFSSRDFDAVLQGVAGIFKPHRLCLHGAGADLQARMYHLRQGHASVNRLEYGAEVDIDPDRLDDFFLLQIPIHGTAHIACGNRQFESSPRVASLISPTLPVHMRWHAGNAQICVRFERAMVERHCAAHLGHGLDKPLEFDPALRLDTAAAGYFMRLLAVFKEECAPSRRSDAGIYPFMHPLAHARVAEQFSITLLNALVYGQESNITEALRQPGAHLAPRFVRRVEDYIHHHYAEAVTIETLAAVAGVSTRSLFSGFRDFRNTTPMAYLKTVRLEKARAALQSGAAANAAAVTRIAFDCGFTHLGRFAADYRTHYGELPSVTARLMRR